jgi:hypothetical protein
MRATSVYVAAVVLGMVTLLAAVADGAPPEVRITRLAPYLERAKTLAKTWQADAKLYQLTVEAEADGSIVSANLISGDKLRGRKILAYFHSASTAKRQSYALNGATGEWVDYIADAMPAAEGVPVIPNNFPEWSQVIQAASKTVAGRFENGPDAEFYATLTGTWDPMRNAHGSTWEAFAYNVPPEGEAGLSNLVAVHGEATPGVERAEAVSERVDEGKPSEYSLLAGTERQRQSVTEMITLGRLPAAGEALDVKVTPDGRHWFYVANGEKAATGYVSKSAPGLRVVMDGVASAPFTSIGDLYASRKSGRLAFAAKRGPQWFVVIDGTEYPISEKEEETLLGWRALSQVWMSDDGQHWAFVLTQARMDDVDGWYIEDAPYVDGKPVEPVMRRAPGKSASSDEQRAMYDLRGITTFAFSPDGTGWAFVHEGVGGARVVVKGKPATEAFAKVSPSSLLFTPQGTLLWISSNGETSTLWRDGEDAGHSPGVGTITDVSPDGQRVAVSCISDEYDTIHVLSGDQTLTFGPGSMLGYFMFSPDSKRCVAVDWKDDDETLIVDGKIVQSAEEFVDPAFFKDGRLVYGAQTKGKPAVLVVDNREERTLYDEIERVDLTDSGSIAYVGLNEVAGPQPMATLVVDGKILDQVSEISNLAFFADGAPIYQVRTEPGSKRVPIYRGVEQPAAPLLTEVDGQKLPFGAEFVIDGPDSAHYISLCEDGRVALATVHPRRDQPAPR